MESSEKPLLTEGNPGRHLLRLGLPMTWGLLAVISYHLVDMYFVSLLGTGALAAFTFTFPMTMFVFHLIMGMGIATTSVVSRQAGRGDIQAVRRFITHSTLIAVCAGLALSLAGLLALDEVLEVMDADMSLIPVIREYMVPWLAGGVFFAIPVVNNSAMRAVGDSFTPAMLMTAVALINVVLDPLLIFGLWGFPKMGVQGAAVATVAAHACAAIAAIFILAFKKKLLFRAPLRPDLLTGSLKSLMHIALPAGIGNIVMPVANGIMIAILADFGTKSVASFGIALRVEAFALLPIMAAGVSMAPVIGQNWSAKKYARVRETFAWGFSFCVLWSLFAALVLALFARQLAGVFSGDPEIIDRVTFYFLAVPVTYTAGTLVNVWASSFNAMGHPIRSLVIMSVRMLAVQVPLAFAASVFFGTVGVFVAIAASNLITGAIFHLVNTRKYRVLEAKSA